MIQNEKTPGRETVTIIEIDQDFCNLTYGESPCTAVLGGTGSIKCYNTFITCQDKPNYDKGSLTLRFGYRDEAKPKDVYILPFLRSVSTTPTKLNVGGGSRSSSGLGNRAEITITMGDYPHTDFKVDKYRNERSFDPLTRGTFWSKFLARNPFYVGRPIRVREGYKGQAIDDMVTRHYVIDSINGPSADGSVSIRARDILALAEDRKAKAPKPSNGALALDITAGASTFEVAGADISDYQGTGIDAVRIGDEVIGFSSVTTLGSGNLEFSGLTRGSDNTEAEDHSQDDGVQPCLRYTDERVESVIYDLLNRFSNIDVATFINLTEWQDEAETWLADFRLDRLITEPTGVEKLISQVTESCLCYVWQDERAQKIEFKAIRPPVETPVTLGERYNILAGTDRLTVDQSQRFSRVILYYDQRDPTEELDKTSNYGEIEFRTDPEFEGPNGFDDEATKIIFSPWLVRRSQAIALTARLIARYKLAPKFVRIDVDAKDRATWTGDVVDVTMDTLVDETGAPKTTRMQVIEAEEVQSGHMVRYKMQEYEFVSRYGYITPDVYPDYSAATDEQKEDGGFIAPDSGEFADGTEAYRIV